MGKKKNQTKTYGAVFLKISCNANRHITGTARRGRLIRTKDAALHHSWHCHIHSAQKLGHRTDSRTAN
ncbi:hypothetical protein FKM82_019402 [Ascaphus truei]